jgi:integrase
VFKILFATYGVGMSLFKYKGSNVWWYDFHFAGERQRASTKTRSKTLAKEAERSRRRELELGYNHVKLRKSPVSFASAADEYLKAKKLTLAPHTLNNERLNLDKLLLMFPNKLITDFHGEDVKRYQDHRIAQGARPKTVNLEIGSLRAVLRRNKCWADIQPDVRLLPLLEEVGQALDEEEEDCLVEKCRKSPTPHLSVVVLLALCTCMRKDEIKNLQWWRIDLKTRVIVVGKSKTPHGRNRRIPINSRLFECLNEWASHFPDRQPEHYVLPTLIRVRKNAGSVSTRRFGYGEYEYLPEKHISNWEKPWCDAKREAGLSCRFHDLRHTGCTRMLEAGVPFAVVSAIMGWSAGTTIQMAKRYGHIGQKSFQDAVSALDRKKASVS